MIKPAVQNFECRIGATWRLPFWIRDKETGAPINLTGATPIWRILTTPDSIDYTPANNKLTITNPTAGEITLNVSDTETGNYTWQASKFYIAIRFADGTLLPYVEGQMKLVSLGG